MFKFKMRRAGHVALTGDMKYAYKILVGKPEGKRPLGRPKLRKKDNIRMNLRETEWEDVDWMYLAKDADQWRAVVNTVINPTIQ
jgi:hypothetical protein